jgi:hypothetical protein
MPVTVPFRGKSNFHHGLRFVVPFGLILRKADTEVQVDGIFGTHRLQLGLSLTSCSDQQLFLNCSNNRPVRLNVFSLRPITSATTTAEDPTAPASYGHHSR